MTLYRWLMTRQSTKKEHGIAAEAESYSTDKVNVWFTLILLITIIAVFNLFYSSTKLLWLGMKCVFKHQDLQYLC